VELPFGPGGDDEVGRVGFDDGPVEEVDAVAVGESPRGGLACAVEEGVTGQQAVVGCEQGFEVVVEPVEGLQRASGEDDASLEGYGRPVSR
jgi:hypothetical protein